MKNLLLFLGTISSTILPIGTVLSCTKKKDEKNKMNTDKKTNELIINLEKYQSPKQIIDVILEKSNMKYPKNFLEILEVDNFNKPTKLTEKSRQAFLSYHKGVKPLKVVLKFANKSIVSTIDLTSEIKIITSELEKSKYVDDFQKAFNKMSTDAILSSTDSTKRTSNISAYFGKLSPDLGLLMSRMRVISDKAWHAYNQETEKNHAFIWKLISSNVFKKWNANRKYELISLDGKKIMEKNSGEFFDNVSKENKDKKTENTMFMMPVPKLPEQSSNFEAAFAIASLNLWKPINKR